MKVWILLYKEGELEDIRTSVEGVYSSEEALVAGVTKKYGDNVERHEKWFHPDEGEYPYGGLTFEVFDVEG